MKFLMWALIFNLATSTFLINPVSSESDEPSTATCSASDRDALLGFKSKISKDTTAFLDSWDASGNHNCCNGGWEGVVCSGAGRVITLTLICPSPDDSSIYMNGTLSPSLGSLSFLETLVITGMKRITGEIPEIFSNLTRLINLVLDDNAFGGPIPSSLPHLKKIQTISLSGNRLTGQIPSSLGNLTNLSVLSLARNFLTGPIPAAFSNLKGLTFLDLSFNSLSGPIPGFILQLHNLTNLVLSKNQLSRPIPAPPIGPSQLSELSVDQNQLVGEIPARIGNLKSLTVLRLSCNKLTGQIPDSIFNLLNLSNLNLSRNLLTSPLPGKAFRTGLPALLSIDLSYNNLTLRTVPDWITNKPLSDVHLVGCELHGPLPNFTKPDSLSTIDLSDNYFTTGISGFLKRMTSLNSANISNNLLRGDLSTVGLPYQISVLDLSSNKLFGSLSRLLTNESNKFLKVIDVSKNNISGKIPEFRGGLAYKVLNLGSNNIWGQIPSSVSKLDKLERLDISRNGITGSIPTGLGSLMNLQWFDLSINGLSGRIPDHWPTAKTLKHVNFRTNKLCGQIPQIRPFNIFPAAAYAHNLCLCGKPLGPCKKKKN